MLIFSLASGKVFSEEEIATAILNISKKYKIKPQILFTIASIESDFEPLAIAVETSPRSAKVLTMLRSQGIRVIGGGETFHSKKSVVSIYPDDLDAAILIAEVLEKEGFIFDLGIMQINTFNFNLAESIEMFYPNKNLEKAAIHLSGCIKRFKKEAHQIECYNRGGGNLNKMLKKGGKYYPYYKRYKKHYKRIFSNA